MASPRRTQYTDAYVATAYGPRGIRCNAVVPGLVLSPAAASVSAEALAPLVEKHLTPYIGVPEDVAYLVAFLASDEARYITGQLIVIDGGISATSSGTPTCAASAWRAVNGPGLSKGGRKDDTQFFQRLLASPTGTEWIRRHCRPITFNAEPHGVQRTARPAAPVGHALPGAEWNNQNHVAEGHRSVMHALFTALAVVFDADPDGRLPTQCRADHEAHGR